MFYYDFLLIHNFFNKIKLKFKPSKIKITGSLDSTDVRFINKAGITFFISSY